MTKPIGKPPPRYKFLLHPYEHERLSRCPLYKKPTHPRKFALFIVVEKFEAISLGKTGPYCSKSELICGHCKGREERIAAALPGFVPNKKKRGSGYFVAGTVD